MAGHESGEASVPKSLDEKRIPEMIDRGKGVVEWVPRKTTETILERLGIIDR